MSRKQGTRFKRFRNIALAGGTAFAVNLLLKSLRYEVEGWERVKLEAWHGRGVIFCFWHNSIMIPLGHESRRDCKGLMSLGADGEFAARVIRHFGVESIRGSSSRGGASLLQKLMNEAGPGSIFAVTPDGPRGPRYQLAGGSPWMASRTGIPLAPVGMALSRNWKLNSWDRFRIPKPFARAVMMFGAPIHVPRDLDRDGLTQTASELEKEMHCLTRTAAHKVGCAWPD